jgi:hypothetical protein
MGSPFATTGTLHSFTGHPGTATAFLVIAVGLTLYFLYKSFKIKHH